MPTEFFVFFLCHSAKSLYSHLSCLALCLYVFLTLRDHAKVSPTCYQAFDSAHSQLEATLTCQRFSLVSPDQPVVLASLFHFKDCHGVSVTCHPTATTADCGSYQICSKVQL